MDDIILGQLIAFAHKIQETILKDSGKISGEDHAGGQGSLNNTEGETWKSRDYCCDL